MLGREEDSSLEGFCINTITSKYKGILKTKTIIQTKQMFLLVHILSTISS